MGLRIIIQSMCLTQLIKLKYLNKIFWYYTVPLVESVLSSSFKLKKKYFLKKRMIQLNSTKLIIELTVEKKSARGVDNPHTGHCKLVQELYNSNNQNR